MDTGTSFRPATVEAGRGRPFRFRLVLRAADGELRAWMGAGWSTLVGLALTAAFAAAGSLAAGAFGPTRDPAGGALLGAACGAGAAAFHLRPRRVLFRRLGGIWRWTDHMLPTERAWRDITTEDPLRMEREPAATVEAFTLRAGPFRLLSYLGDPGTAKSVVAAFRAAGVPLRTVTRREEE